MNILYDHQIFSAQKIGGVSRYYAELFRNFNKLDGVDFELALNYSDNIYIDGFGTSCPKLISKIPNKYVNYFGNVIYDKLNEVNSLKKIKNSEYDVFHPTYYNLYYQKYLKKPLVITVLDLIHELYFRDLPNDKTKYNKKLLCEQADKIIAISNSTKNDLISLLKIEPEKIIVTHLSGGFERPLKILNKTEMGLPEKYILFVGSRQWYKNFIRFFEAVTPLLISDKTLKIVCTGLEFTKSEIQMFEISGVRNQMVRYFCNEDDFYNVYNLAELFVFPSEYEGFGIPTLEAFSADCPVVLSNTSSMPEVGGDAVLYIDPYDVADIRSKIEQLLFNKELRLRLIEKGHRQLKKFSWEKTAKETFNVYQAIS